MTRRVARLVDEGLVRRADADADGRGVVVALTHAGLGRLTETAPIHARGIAEYFVSRLETSELAVLERALDKVTVTCTSESCRARQNPLLHWTDVFGQREGESHRICVRNQVGRNKRTVEPARGAMAQRAACQCPICLLSGGPR